MKISAVVDLLRATRRFRQLGGVLEFAALKSVPGALPAAYVVPEGYSAGRNGLANGFDQKLEHGFSVVIMLAASVRGDQVVSDELDELERVAIDTIAGVTLPGHSGPTQLAGGKLVSAGGSQVLWAVSFRTPSHVRKVS